MDTASFFLVLKMLILCKPCVGVVEKVVQKRREVNNLEEGLRQQVKSSDIARGIAMLDASVEQMCTLISHSQYH